MKTLDHLPRLISLSGKSGAGKDTLAGILIDNYDYERVAFADPIKRFVGELFDLSTEQLWGELRNQPDERLELAPREVYQRFGDFCREIDPQVWIRKWHRAVTGRLDTGRRVVCTDVRTPAELERVKELGGSCWLIERPEAGAPGKLGQHRTEQALTKGSRERFDAVINNDGTLAELEMKIHSKLELIL